MTITLLIWLLLYIEAGTIGIAFQRLFDPDNSTRRVGLNQILFGVIIITTLGAYFSLFSNIGFIFSAFLFLLTLILFFIYRPHLFDLKFFEGKSWLQKFAWFALFSLVLELSTHRILNPDTNIYHAQAIRWIENYPAIFGLGNLYGRLAFNSSWFLTNSIYSFSFLGGQSYHVVTGFLFLVIISDQIIKISPTGHSPTKVDFLRVAIIVSGILYLSSDISSPGSDTPTTLIIWIISVLVLDYHDYRTDENLFLIVALSVFAITIKLSSIMISFFMIVVLIIFVLNHHGKRFRISLLVSSLIFLPFLLRNYVLSGYLLYPVPEINLFDVPWKVLIERVIDERNGILIWGRLPGYAIKEVLDLPFSKWFPIWYGHQSPGRQILVIVAFSSIIPMAASLYTKAASKFYLIVHLGFYCGFVFWLITSPDYRFGYGFLIPTITLAYVPLIKSIWIKISLGLQFGKTILFLLSALLCFTFWFSFEPESFNSRIFHPIPYDQVKTISCTIGNSDVFCSKNFSQCSYYSFPCIPQQRPWVFLVGNGFEKGFIGKK